MRRLKKQKKTIDKKIYDGLCYFKIFEKANIISGLRWHLKDTIIKNWIFHALPILLRESVRDDAGWSILGEREILLFTGFYK